MPTKLIAIACAAAAAAFVVATPLAAEHDHRGHDAPARLSSDQGTKWPTDEPLRRGMDQVRTVMAGGLPRIHADRTKAQEYRNIALAIDQQVAYIVANCHLPPEADAMLHRVIAELLAGAEAMQGKAGSVTPRAGAIRVVQALDDYGRHFDHPGWRPLAH